MCPHEFSDDEEELHKSLSGFGESVVLYPLSGNHTIE